MLDGYQGDFRQHEGFHTYWMNDYYMKEDFAIFSNDKDVALDIYRWINQDLFIDFL